jgi:hypothetical protein
MGMRDPYECLAVSRSATADEIKQSFRLLAKMLHPDANDDPKAAAVFTELNAAHQILADEEKRRAFDRGEIDAEGRPTRRVIARHSRLSAWYIATRLLVVIAMLATTATLIMRGLAPEEKVSANSDGGNTILSRFGAIEERERAPQPERPDPGVQPEPRLIFPQGASFAATDSIPLCVQVEGGTVGLALEISGLPSGATLSSGRDLGGGRWRILATDVINATIRPPPGFSGSIDVALELRLVDDTVVDSGSLHLEWLKKPGTAPAPIGPAVATAASVGSAEKATAVAALTDQNGIQQATDSPGDPIELLIGRSEKLLSDGEGEEARLLLQPAAEAHDARAALALGATYDPIMLAILRAHGVTANVSMAVDWYKRASEFGSQKAQQRLDLLTAASTTIASLHEMAISHNASPKAMPTPVEKPTRHVVLRDSIHQQRTPHRRYRVEVAGGGVGAYPDPLMMAPAFIQ